MTLVSLAEVVRYVPFRDPLWGGWDYWPLFAIPLCFGVAIIYKAVRTDDLTGFPRTATRWALLMMGAMVALAAVLRAVLWLTEL